MRSLLFGALLPLTLSPALAAEEFYLVQEVSTKHCRVVETPPATTDVSLLMGGRLFVTKKEAQAALSSLAPCGKDDARGVSVSNIGGRTTSR